MKRITPLIIPALVALLVSSPVWAEGRLYLCSVKDLQSLGNDGLLERTRATKLQLKEWENISFDEATGIMRFGKSDVLRKMVLVQKRSLVNGIVRMHKYKGPKSSGVEVLNIKTYMEGMPFKFSTSYEVVTGLCERM